MPIAFSIPSALSVAGALSVTAAGHIVGTPTTNTGSGAISVVSSTSLVDTTGGGAYTLANGTSSGQIKIISMVAGSTVATVTPDGTALGWTSLILNAIGSAVILQWYTTYGWAVIGGFNVTMNMT